jgi:hypothetical protein
MSRAVQAAVEATSEDDTLILVTAEKSASDGSADRARGP